MITRMLIDARHQEETRVAVLRGNRIEEFDFESSDHKQIKGNIYLAKVTRVEPSLQAAFIDFGGNRHGFLAFSEIHPDYYQIPREDREALLAEEAQAAEEEAELLAAEDEEDDGDDHRHGDGDHDGNGNGEAFADELAGDGLSEMAPVDAPEDAAGNDGSDDGEDAPGELSGDGSQGEDRGRGRRGARKGKARGSDEARARRLALRRRYKIQDVIHRRQVMLVQVVKEERGNKGAALTTYLSLAGRYCVLMPNSSHGGGISRKISSASDRKRLKSIIAELDLPKSMGCIVRTAGLARTKPEIKRDFDYLARLWDEIRERTLQSVAPATIHSDSDLIKRAIRDIYNREIEEVIVEGAEGYRAAREFMKLLMPSHARRVKSYADPVPLFQRFGAEDQLSAMYDPVVQLKSGGYLVINPTEALVSIDINSGRSTKEHGIEATAVKTNLEAADEIARQLRLRDMAGLVVIDFIDMEHGSNVRKVEKAMKEALRNDRARIQVGRISGFGLMEMSRQRLRTGVLEATTRTCPHCDGTGLVRTASSAGLSALRMLEDEAAKGRGSIITLTASQEAAIYVLNQKRRDIGELESRYGVRVEIVPDGEIEGARMRVGSSGPKPAFTPVFEAIVDDEVDLPEEDEFDEDRAEAVEEGGERERPARSAATRDEARQADGEDEGRGRKRRRRRRGRRGRREEGEQEGLERQDSAGEGETGADDSDDTAELEQATQDTVAGPLDVAAEDSEARERRPRRRGGRGRRGARTDDAGEMAVSAEDAAGLPDMADAGAPASMQDAVAAAAGDPATAAAEPEPKPRRTRRRKSDAADAVAEAAPAAAEAAAEDKPKRRRRTKASEDAGQPAAEQPAEAEAPKPRARRSRRKADEQDNAAPAEGGADEAAPGDTPPDAAAPAEVPLAAADGTSDGKAMAANGADLVVAGANDAGGADGSETTDGAQDAGSAAPAPARRGWWQRTFGS